jgi:hypothetical protein
MTCLRYPKKMRNQEVMILPCRPSRNPLPLGQHSRSPRGTLFVMIANNYTDTWLVSSVEEDDITAEGNLFSLLPFY